MNVFERKKKPNKVTFGREKEDMREAGRICKIRSFTTYKTPNCSSVIKYKSRYEAKHLACMEYMRMLHNV